MPRYPDEVRATGPDGNVFAVIGRAITLLRAHGVSEVDVPAFRERCLSARAYGDVLEIVREYFTVTT